MADQLDLEKTYRAILNAARNGRFISFGDLAKANDAKWQTVRYDMYRHLGNLVEIAAARGWPMPSAIVVNQDNIETGKLDGKTRDGFVNAAKEFGFDVSDPKTFVEEQQQAMFDWAESAPDKLALSQEEQLPTGNIGGPQFVRLFGPLLDALRLLNGVGEPRQVCREIAKSPLVADEDLKATNKKGGSKFENQVGWARFYLVKAGLIEGKERGVWQLTRAGHETRLDLPAAVALFRAIRDRFQSSSAEEIDDADPPREVDLSDLFDDVNRRFWFVGAVWDGNDDQSERFYDEGIWQNGHTDKFMDRVTRMQPGDRIAIKSSFVRKYGLPFDNQDRHVSCMRIKAIGTVTEAATDGRTVKVDWGPFDDPRDWYFYTYRVTVVEADTSDEFARRLIQFAFGDQKQDYQYWLRQPYWAKRYRAPAPTPTEIGIEEEADADPDEAEISPYGIDDILEDGCFLPQEFLASALSRLTSKLNVILQGPPGTGKTWLAKRLGYALIGTRDRAVIRKRTRTIQFHPSLSYEDFVRGWRPDGDGHLSLIDGVFLESVEAARAEPDRPFVVIIDEINRGNPAQIFGEMLTLLENDKRREEEAIELAYRRELGERVFIPQNLYVIGTMNIADRSLALVDLALRRRFAFVTLETVLNESWRKWCVERAGMDEAVLAEVRRRMTDLNDEISADRTLGAQFKIGHSYVTPAPGDTIQDTTAWFREIVEAEIEPLLEEYWFDNLDKVAKSKAQLLAGL